MGRLLLLLGLAGCLSLATAADLTDCKRTTGFPKEVCYVPKCTDAIRDHIKEEFNAAFKYMYLGSHFAQDTVDRPGLADFLFEAAKEERGHAIQMLDYLNLRGIKLDSHLNYNFDIEAAVTGVTLNYRDALKEALNMEIQVTDLIYKVVDNCGDDFHGADVFTNPILDEQHDGVRKLQGALKTYDDLMAGADFGAGEKFAEYLFDKKMVAGEIF